LSIGILTDLEIFVYKTTSSTGMTLSYLNVEARICKSNLQQGTS
jgi:hypothetical protein